jgi:TonB family protein
MPPLTKDSSILTATPERQSRPGSVPTSPAESAAKQQAVALEVPVCVHGAHTVEGSGKREPFSESTKTVMVFGAGAVIRLTSAVTPGQLLFLTNERTKKEMVCQVVKSKNYRNVNGYVELEFTEPAVGFWGMRFPGDRIGSGPQPASSSNGSQVASPKTSPATANGAPSNGIPKSTTQAPVKTNVEAKPTAPKLVAPEAAVAPKSTSPKASTAVSSIVPPPLDSATYFGAPKAEATETPAAVAAKSPSPAASEVNRVERLQKKPEPVSPVTAAPPVPAAPKTTPGAAVLQSPSPNFPTFDVTQTSEKPASLFTPAPEPAADLSKVDLSSLAPFFEANAPAAPVEPPPPAVQVPIDPETETLKHQTARLQEELSSMNFSEPASDSAADKSLEAPCFPIAEKDPTNEKPAQILEPASVPLPAPLSEPILSELSEATVETPAAPVSVLQTSPVQTPSLNSLEQEELKIPSWLEPLARSTAAPSSTQELVLREKAKHFTEKQPAEIEELTAERSALVEEKGGRSSVARIPEFGNALPFDIDEKESSAESPATKSRKTMLYAAIGAGLVLLPAAGWWYIYQRASGSYAGVSTAETTAVSAPTASLPAKPQEDVALQMNVPAQVTPALPAPLVKSDSSVQASSGSKLSGPASSGLLPTSARSVEPSPNSVNNGTVVAKSNAEQPAAAASVKKPTLGEVHLAAPKVARSQRAQNGAETEAGLSLEEVRSETDADSLTSSLTGGNKEPAAPEAPPAVGGDVKQAKLISSVPPVYPTMAKTQHVSGNVTVDALIDATGRVTTMKVISGPPLLHQAAMDALKQWKYQPAMLDGKAVPMHLSVTIQFHLQ